MVYSMLYFELDNDNMESSKHRSIFILPIFILKCFTKPFIIRDYYYYDDDDDDDDD